MKILRPITVNDAALLASSIAENDYAAYSAATTYGQGARVIIAATHRVYESLAASNINHPPATSPTWWLEIGATNRWRMFDYSVTSQSSAADQIAVTIKATGRANAIALANVSAANARIVVTDAVDGIVYDRTFSLTSTSGIDDYYQYFFEPIVRMGDLVVLDMPPYYAPEIQVTLTAPGETVKVGALLLGQQITVGGLQYGAGVGIQDYSVKKQDEFGNHTIVKRAFSKRASFTVWIARSMVDYLHDMLAGYRAEPIVYIGSELYSATVVYGFFKDFNIAIAYATESVCTIDLEGLT